jgi:hypothetical protein
MGPNIVCSTDYTPLQLSGAFLPSIIHYDSLKAEAVSLLFYSQYLRSILYQLSSPKNSAAK